MLIFKIWHANDSNVMQMHLFSKQIFKQSYGMRGIKKKIIKFKNPLASWDLRVIYPKNGGELRHT